MWLFLKSSCAPRSLRVCSVFDSLAAETPLPL